MIRRSPSFARDLATGIMLSLRWLRGKPSVFRKRAVPWWYGFVPGLVGVVPLTIVFGVAAAVAWHSGDADQARKIGAYYIGMSAVLFVSTWGILGFSAGGTSSETD